MGQIEFFDHTADVGLRIRATSLDDLFVSAAQGLVSYVVANPEAVRTARTDSIELKASSLTDLLAAWLSEIIFRIETEHRLFVQFEVRVSPDGRSLHATLGGEPIDRNRHTLDHEVKAVTQHGLKIVHDQNEWLAEVILDI